MEENITDHFPEGAVKDHRMEKRCQGMPYTTFGELQFCIAKEGNVGSGEWVGE